MKVICLGDSNTYGYDPRSWFGGEYDAPWVKLLAEQTGWTVINEGENGREIPRKSVFLPPDTDLLMVMLGTNDLLQGRSPESAAAAMEAFLSGLSIKPEKLLLIAPPPMVLGPDQRLADASRQLSEHYRAIANRLGIGFADAGEWGISLCFDGVHFTEEGHRTFADKLIKIIKTSKCN